NHVQTIHKPEGRLQNCPRLVYQCCVEIRFCHPNAKCLLTRNFRKNWRNLTKIGHDDDAEKSNSEAPKIIKVQQNIPIKEGKILGKYPKTSVYCKCPKCKVDGMTIIKKGKICDSPAGAEECSRRFTDLLPRFFLSFFFIFIFSVFLFIFSPEIRESIVAEFELERFIFFVFVLIIISCGYGLNKTEYKVITHHICCSCSKRIGSNVE
ncbi:unnamed protein product, partial [Oikopleura dioica]